MIFKAESADFFRIWKEINENSSIDKQKLRLMNVYFEGGFGCRIGWEL